MTRRNRVDPWGDLHAVSTRGLFTGNRGCLVDDDGAIVRHHRSTTLWITCRTSFRGWRHPLDAPHVWTPLFFLDGRTLQPLKTAGSTAVLQGTTVKLKAEAASLLNDTFGTDALKGGLVIGVAKITVNVA